MIHVRAAVAKNTKSAMESNRQQDFTRKMVIAVREDVASWQLTNTVAHIAAYLGNKLPETFDTGDHFISADDHPFPRNSQYAIVTLKATATDLSELLPKLRDQKLLWIAYVQEMIDFIDDDELAEALKKVASHEMNVLGIGIFGTKDELKALTGHLKLWK